MVTATNFFLEIGGCHHSLNYGLIIKLALFTFCCFLLGNFLNDLFLLGSAADHLGARDIALFIDEIKIPYFSLDTDFCNFIRSSTLFVATSHLGRGDIPLLVYEIKETLFFLDANFSNFFCSHAIVLLGCVLIFKFRYLF